MESIASGSWTPGSKVGPYVLRHPLARGGMAELYVADTGSRASQVVLKRVRADFSTRGDFARMFRRESTLMRALDHPNVVRVVDTGREGDEGYIAMEYLKGRDVRTIVRAFQKQGVRIPFGAALHLCMELLEGLDYVHTCVDGSGAPLSIVHRDVSPSNVFVTLEGAVKLLDFGIAKADLGTPGCSSPGPKGKGCYMSPEQCRVRDVDARSDLFSVAALLYELTTMRRAFVGPNDMAILLAVLDGDFRRPSTVLPDYPPALESVVVRGLAVDPDDRFASAAAMRDALADVVRDLELRAGPQALMGALASIDTLPVDRPPLASAPAQASMSAPMSWPWGRAAAVDNDAPTRTDRGAPVGATSAVPERTRTPWWLAAVAVLVVGVVAWFPWRNRPPTDVATPASWEASARAAPSGIVPEARPAQDHALAPPPDPPRTADPSPPMSSAADSEPPAPSAAKTSAPSRRPSRPRPRPAADRTAPPGAAEPSAPPEPQSHAKPEPTSVEPTRRRLTDTLRPPRG